MCSRIRNHWGLLPAKGGPAPRPARNFVRIPVPQLSASCRPVRQGGIERFPWGASQCVSPEHYAARWIAQATRRTPAPAGMSHTRHESSRQPANLLPMIAPPLDLRAALADAVAAYEASGNLGGLMARLHEIRDSGMADALVAAVEPYLHMPEVAGPLYERIVDEQPRNARALVILANAYWLSGRGPDVVGELATRALAVDPANRGAWHMWALTEGNQRDRTVRWMQVVQRFPDDQLAKAALADNASSLASAEHDREALALAISTYEELLALSTNEQQRAALETALSALRKFRI